MPANIINGWTSSSLGPSYSVVNSILSGGGHPGTTAPASSLIPPAVSGANPPGGGGGGGHLPNRNPLPSIPPVNVPPSSSVGDTSGGLATGGRSGPMLTPEQSYSRYLQARAAAENSTPYTNALNILGQGTFLPGVYGSETNQPGQGFGFGSSTQNLGPYSHAATGILNQMLQGPQMSMAYGAPTAQAPAQTPQWGYPSTYGQQASPSGWSSTQGFGSNLGGFGF